MNLLSDGSKPRAAKTFYPDGTMVASHLNYSFPGANPYAITSWDNRVYASGFTDNTLRVFDMDTRTYIQSVTIDSGATGHVCRDMMVGYGGPDEDYFITCLVETSTGGGYVSMNKLTGTVEFGARRIQTDREDPKFLAMDGSNIVPNSDLFWSYSPTDDRWLKSSYNSNGYWSALTGDPESDTTVCLRITRQGWPDGYTNGFFYMSVSSDHDNLKSWSEGFGGDLILKQTLAMPTTACYHISSYEDTAYVCGLGELIACDIPSYNGMSVHSSLSGLYTARMSIATRDVVFCMSSTRIQSINVQNPASMSTISTKILTSGAYRFTIKDNYMIIADYSGDRLVVQELGGTWE